MSQQAETEETPAEQAKPFRELAEKKKVRAGHKSYITNISAKARTLLDDYQLS